MYFCVRLCEQGPYELPDTLCPFEKKKTVSNEELEKKENINVNNTLKIALSVLKSLINATWFLKIIF